MTCFANFPFCRLCRRIPEMSPTKLQPLQQQIFTNASRSLPSLLWPWFYGVSRSWDPHVTVTSLAWPMRSSFQLATPGLVCFFGRDGLSMFCCCRTCTHYLRHPLAPPETVAAQPRKQCVCTFSTGTAMRMGNLCHCGADSWRSSVTVTLSVDLRLHHPIIADRLCQIP